MATHEILTLRPSGAGTHTEFWKTGCTQNYLCVDDVTPDDDTTYVRWGTNTWKKDTYSLPNHTTENGVIHAVRVFIRCRHNGIFGDSKTVLRTYSTLYEVDQLTAVGWDTDSEEYTLNPYTGEPWTWDEVDALEVGVSLRGLQDVPQGWGYCTQVYAEVEYTQDYYKDISLKMSLFEVKDIALKASLWEEITYSDDVPLKASIFEGDYKDILLKATLENLVQDGYHDIELKAMLADGGKYAIQIGNYMHDGLQQMVCRRVVTRRASSFEIELYDIGGTNFDLIKYHDPVFIKIKGALVFKGFVEGKKKKDGSVLVTGRDFWGKIQERFVNEVFTQKSASEILTEILGDVALELTPAITATTKLYDREYRNIPFNEIVADFCDLEGFQAYVNVEGEFVYEPEGYTATGIVLNADSGEGGIIDHDFEERGHKLKNVITVFGVAGGPDGEAIAIQVRDPDSVRAHGIREAQFTENALFTEEACRQKAKWYLNRYSTVLEVGSLKIVGNTDITVGSTVIFNLDELSINNKEFVVISIEHSYPNFTTEIMIADFSVDVTDLLQDFIKKIKQADSSQQDNSVPVARYVELSEDIEVSAAYQIYKIQTTGIAEIGNSQIGMGDLYGPYEGAQELIGSGDMVVTDDGINLIRNWLAGDSVNPPDNTYGHIAVGEDSTPAKASDRELGDQDGSREAMDSGYPDKPATKKISFQADIGTAEHNVYIDEIGLFNDATAITDSMICRQVIDTIEKDSTFSLKILITLTLSGA